MNSKNRFILINLVAFEFALLNLALISYLILGLPDISFSTATFFKVIAPLALTFNLSWLFIIYGIRGKEFYFHADSGYIKNYLIKNYLTSLFFFIGFVTTFVALFKIIPLSPPTFIIPIFLFSYLNFLSHKYLLRFLKKRGPEVFANSLLIGSSTVLLDLNGFPNEMALYGYNIIGYLGDQEGELKNTPSSSIVGNINDLADVLKANAIDEIFIAMTALEKRKIKESIRIADSFGVRVKLIPEGPLQVSNNYTADTIGDLAVFKLRQTPLDNINLTILKRLFDLCFSLVVLMALAPLYLIIGLLIVLDSKGPIYYTPYRIGEAGKTFKCYKFRTMSVCDNPLNGTKSTIVNDPRITRVGKFLRKNDLDELPQFFNVLKGEMSVVGPRPHRINLQNDFRKSVSDYMIRGYVKPGITGWAQVNGWRGPTVTDEQKNERVKHDIWYIENWRFLLDIKIIFRTVFGRHRKKAF